jgi:hypothetical protein
MAVQAMTWAWDWIFTGDNGYTVSRQYNFAPSNALAQTSLSTAPPPGSASMGFSQYGNRPEPNGAYNYHNIPPVYYGGGFIGYQPLVYDPNLVSVTWILDGNVEDGQMVGSILFFTFD